MGPNVLVAKIKVNVLFPLLFYFIFFIDSRHPINQRLNMSRLHGRPRLHEPNALVACQPHAFLWLQIPRHMLSQIEAHPNVIVVIPHDKGHFEHGVVVVDPVSPCKLHVRHQQPVAAYPTHPGLKRHKNPRCRFSARDAFAVQQLDSGNHPPTQTHVLWQRPFGHEVRQSLPKHSVVSVAQPCGAVNGLELDKCQQGRGAGGRFT